VDDLVERRREVGAESFIPLERRLLRRSAPDNDEMNLDRLGQSLFEGAALMAIGFAHETLQTIAANGVAGPAAQDESREDDASIGFDDAILDDEPSGARARSGFEDTREGVASAEDRAARERSAGATPRLRLIV
jgi:hypothetical protein